MKLLGKLLRRPRREKREPAPDIGARLRAQKDGVRDQHAQHDYPSRGSGIVAG